MPTKQVIIIRKDLKMRRGKEIAQGAHASSMWLIKRALTLDTECIIGELGFSTAEYDWLEGSFTKVVVTVNSEAELEELNRQAQIEGIECHMITDAGHTEFHGVPTKTCLAIGPDNSDKIDKVTKSLPLY